MSPVMEANQAVASVLIVEEDDATRQLLCEHLEADHFQVAGAKNAEVARSVLAGGDYELVLLDLNVGDEALGLLQEIQQKNENTAVIIISGRASERDRVRGLNEGADDYVVKPFSYGELVARINAVLRRLRKAESVTRVGDIEINQVKGKVTVSGRQVRLTPKELALLKVLASEPSRVFSKEELLRDIWGYRSLGHTRTLDTHMNRLRSKLDPDHRRYVVNCWGVGYRLQFP